MLMFLYYSIFCNASCVNMNRFLCMDIVSSLVLALFQACLTDGTFHLCFLVEILKSTQSISLQRLCALLVRSFVTHQSATKSNDEILLSPQPSAYFFHDDKFPTATSQPDFFMIRWIQ